MVQPEGCVTLPDKLTNTGQILLRVTDLDGTHLRELKIQVVGRLHTCSLWERSGFGLSTLRLLAGLRCGSMSAKQMGGYSGGCTHTGGPVRGLERGL